jgi:hypothetical protein
MLPLNSTIFKFSIKILQFALYTKQWKEKKTSKVDIIATEKSWVGGIPEHRPVIALDPCRLYVPKGSILTLQTCFCGTILHRSFSVGKGDTHDPRFLKTIFFHCPF